jgi:outer membrane protein OmpA-like peptidoglycan-associated protein
LLEVADALLRNPNLELVEIQGHTDSSGDPALNMRLSQRRAEAVQRWLIQHGVESTRLMAKGYGPTRPVVPNITQQNRARNRRVQFRIVRRADLTAAAAR